MRKVGWKVRSDGTADKCDDEPTRWPEPAPRLVDDALGRIRLVRMEANNALSIEAFSGRHELEAFAALAGAALPVKEMCHRIDWAVLAAAHAQNEELWLLADWTDSRLSGLAVLPAPMASLDYSLGPWTFLRRRVRKFQLYRAPITHGPPSRAFLERVFGALATVIGPDGVAYIASAAVGGELHAALGDPTGAARCHFHILPWGNEQPHCRIRWEGSVETYLRSIGHESRRSLRRYSKKLLEDPGVRCRVRRFDSRRDVDDFVRDGNLVSILSYQSRIPGLGLSQNSLEESQIRLAAEDGNFLGHILYIDEEPAAFHYGVTHAGCYFVLQMAYDPKWSHRHIGGVLFLEVLKDLERTRFPIDALDYMSGVTTFKLRTTNEKTPARSYYLFPRTFTGTARYAAMLVANAFSASIGHLLVRFRLKESVLALLRKRVSARRDKPIDLQKKMASSSSTDERQ